MRYVLHGRVRSPFYRTGHGFFYSISGNLTGDLREAHPFLWEGAAKGVLEHMPTEYEWRVCKVHVA